MELEVLQTCFVFALLFVKVAPLWHSGIIWTTGGFGYPNAIYLDASVYERFKYQNIVLPIYQNSAISDFLAH